MFFLSGQHENYLKAKPREEVKLLLKFFFFSFGQTCSKYYKNIYKQNDKKIIIVINNFLVRKLKERKKIKRENNKNNFIYNYNDVF